MACPADLLVFSSSLMLDTGRFVRRLHPRGWAALALAGGWLLFFGRNLLTDRVPYERDILVTVLPLRHYLLERLRAGEIPQWYPYELLGIPFAGTLVASPFHPQVLFFLLFGTATGLKASLLFARLLGLVGAYRLSRELGASRPASVAGAYVFALGGFAVSLTSNPPFLVPFMTAPWVLVFVHRLVDKQRWRDVVLLAIWWALVFLGGDAQLFLELGFVALGMLLAFQATKLAWLRFAVAATLAAALVSVELVPALASEDESIRAFWKPTATLASLWALNPVRVLGFVLPRFVPMLYRNEFGRLFEGEDDLFAGTIFIGALAAALIVLALWKGSRGSLLWVAVAVFGLALAFGHRGGLLEIWWRIAPPFSKFRIPEKYAELTALAIVPLVAAGVDQLREVPRAFVFGIAAIGVLLLLVGAFVPEGSLADAILRWRDVSKPVPTALRAAMGDSMHSGLLISGGFVLLLAGGLFFVERVELLPLLVPALMLFELSHGNAWRNPLASPKVVEDVGELARALQKEQEPGQPPPRVLPARGGTSQKDIQDDDLVRLMHLWFMPDDAGRSHAVAFDENSSAARARVSRLFGSFSSRERPVWLRRFNVCYRAADARDPPRPEDAVRASVVSPPIALVRRDCLPRAYLANAFGAESIEAARDRMRQGLSDDDAVWEGGPAITGAGGTVRWLEAAPEKLRLEVDASAPSALVVSDVFARGWTATVDGSAATIFPTNVAVRGVPVPAGRHRVEMKYQAPGLILGAVLSLLGLAGCLGLWITSRRGESRMDA